MSNNDNIFQSNQDGSEANSNQENNFKSMYVGEGKKYASEDEAYKGLHNAQEHIANLEQQVAELNAKNLKVQTTEEILAEIRAAEGASKSPETIDLSKVSELVRNELTASKQSEIITNNVNSVDMEMKARFGDKARETLNAKAVELGVSIDDMMKTAGTSPNAFLAWFPKPEQTAQQANLSGDVNTRNMESMQTGFKVGTYKYYENLRKTDKARYMKPETQLEMHNQAAKLGEAFYE